VGEEESEVGRTRIILADDHDVVRRGLQALLESEPDFHIVGEAKDGLEAAELVERLRPDVLVLDVVMPGLSGLEVIRRACRTSPHTRVVVLSMYDTQAYVLEALRAGAGAYVLKRSTSEELIRAIREVVNGQFYVSYPLSRRAIEAYAKRAEDIFLDSYESLTNREREVLQLVAEGCSSSEIAGRLFISPRTVEGHRASIMRKLGLHSKTDLIRYALRRGILPLDG